MIFRQIVFFAAFFLEIMLVGVLTSRVFNRRQSVTLDFCLGFVSILSICFLLTALFRVINLSLTALTHTLVSLLIVIDLFSLLCIFRNGVLEECQSQIERVKKILNSNKLIFGLLFCSFLLHLFFSCCCYWPTSDDSYYLPRAMEMVSKNTVNITDSIAWLGYQTDNKYGYFNPSSMEAFRAVLSSITGIPVTVLSRNALCIILVMLSYASVWQLTGSLVGESDNAERIKALTLLLYNIILLLVGGFMKRDIVSFPFWQIRYLWQGKSILISFFFPLIMKLCVDIYRCNGDNHKVWNCCLLLGWAVIAAVSTTRVAVIFTPILCFILGIPYIVMNIVKRKFQWQIVPQILVAFIPVIIVASISMIAMTDSSGGGLFSTSQPLDIHKWNEVFGEMFSIGHWIFWGLYAISLLYLIHKGDSIQKAVLIGAPIVLFLTFLNPLLIRIVVKFIKYSIYWRLYWLLPMWYVFPFVLSIIICSNMTMKEINSFVIGFTVPLLLCGYVFIWGRVEIRNSMYSLDRRTESVAKFILDDYSGGTKPVVLDMTYQFKGVVEIRQYSTDIILYAGHRDTQRAIIQDTSLQSLYKELYNGESLSNEEMESVIKNGEIDYVTSKTDEEAQFENLFCLKKVFTVDDFIVWSVQK